MQYIDLVEFFGGPTKTAKILGTTVANVANWKRNGIPLKWQIEACRLSGYELFVEFVDLQAINAKNDHNES